MPHAAPAKENTGDTQDGSQGKVGLEETQITEVEGTEEPNIALKPSPALKAKSESNDENAIIGSEKKTSSENVSEGGSSSDKEGKNKDSTGSGVSAVAEPA